MCDAADSCETAMPRSVIEKSLFALILFGYLFAGALYAIYTPPWQAPDEPAHYNYIKQAAAHGCCPLIESGDWQSDYLSQLTTAKFAPEHLDRLDTIQYEDHHPPLYYLLASVLYKLNDGDLIALRLLSVVLGAAVVCLSYMISRCISPDQPQISLGTMALVAFTPQHLSMMASVNNDALAEVLVALALLWLIRYLNSEGVPVWQLGLIVGLALLTKITIYFLALIVPLGIWLNWRRDGRSTQALLRPIAAFVLIAGLIGGLWWLRNIAVYGFPDFLGLVAHDAVVADQPRSDDYIAQHGMTNYISRMLGTTFKSFWGQFGWMALPLDNVLGGWIYRGFGLFVIAGLSGLLLACRPRVDVNQELASQRIPRNVLTLLLTATLLVALQFVYYNIEFLQWQGRYLFPALIPMAFLLVLGGDHWRTRLLSRWGALRWLTPLGLTCLFGLDIYLLFRAIVPGLSP
jgi:4-amino-4-deoxy-L-arabinose transferase-like glycosyltransferase